MDTKGEDINSWQYYSRIRRERGASAKNTLDLFNRTVHVGSGDSPHPLRYKVVLVIF